MSLVEVKVDFNVKLLNQTCKTVDRLVSPD